MMFVNPDGSWNSKTDLRIRPTDLSWHCSILVTTREMPFRNYRGKTSETLKAREDKIDEAKEQKTLKNRGKKVEL